jgi:ribosome biogenesis protein Tsr3
MSEVALHENGVGKEPLQIMVVDGTWRQVKAMVKELDRMVEKNFPSLPPLTHVKLLPDTLR